MKVNFESARLLIGIHCRGGLTKPLAVELNGSTINVDSGDASEFTEFFAPLDATVQSGLIRNQNTIKVNAESGVTITSVQLITFAKTSL